MYDSVVLMMDFALRDFTRAQHHHVRYPSTCGCAYRLCICTGLRHASTCGADTTIRDMLARDENQSGYVLRPRSMRPSMSAIRPLYVSVSETPFALLG